MHCNNGLNNKLVESLVENKVAQETGDLKYLQDSMYDFIKTLKEIVLGEYSSEFFNEYVDEALKLHGSNLEEFLKIPKMGLELRQALNSIDEAIDTSNQEFKDNLVLLLDRFQTTLDNMEYQARDPYDTAVELGFTGTKQEWLEHLEGDSAYVIAVKNGYTGTEEDWIKHLEGDSAYKIAADNGFVGSKQEWLTSLKPTEGTLQALTKFMNNDSVTDVTVPELGTIPSLQGHIKQMFENGGLPATPFATKALMTASALVDGEYAQVTDDTVNNGLYVKTAGAWIKSRYSVEVLAIRTIIESLQFGEAKDNISIKDLESLYDSSTHVDGVYVGAGRVIGGSRTSRISYMPVESGSSYLMTSTMDGGLTGFLAGSKELTTEIGSKLTALPKPTQFNGYSLLKIPYGVDYLYLNSKLSGRDLDEDLAIYKIPSSEVYGILGFDFKDKDGAKGVKEYPNEFESIQQKDGLYVWTAGSIAVATASSSIGATMSVMPVKPNTRYALGVKDSAEILIGNNVFAIGYSMEGDVVSGRIGNGARLPFFEFEGTNFIEFTTPHDANYIYFTSRLTNHGWDIRENGYIAEIPNGESVVIPSVTKIGEYAIRDELAHAILSRIQGTYTSPLEGKQWTAIGDSITEHNFRASKNYHDFIKDAVDNLSVVNMGSSGTGFYGRHGVADVIVGSPDLITVMFGTNDRPTRGKPRGEFLDVGTGTINGCINNTILGLMNNFPESKIAFITPIPMSSRWGVVDDTSGDEYTLVTIADLVVKYCNHYSIPCLDLYRSSGLRPWLDNHNVKYFSSSASPEGDGVHPNADGHKIIAARIKPFLESLFL